MADGAITVTSLIANGGAQQIVLTWTSDIGSCLPYLGLERYEVWAASTNNRANASKVAEVADFQYTHPNLPTKTRRFYWVRARDLSKNLGDFHPLSATAGVEATTFLPTVDPDTLEGELEELTLGLTAGGTIKFVRLTGVRSGYSRIDAKALYDLADDSDRAAAWGLDTPADKSKPSEFWVRADWFRLRNSAGVLSAAFDANGKLEVSVLKAKSVDAGEVMINGSTITDVIADQAVSKTVATTPSDYGSLVSGTQWVTLKTSVINIQNKDGMRRVRAEASATFERNDGGGPRTIRMRLTKNDVVMRSSSFDKYQGVGPMSWPISFVDTSPSNGNDEWRFQAAGVGTDVRDCDLTLTGFKR